MVLWFRVSALGICGWRGCRRGFYGVLWGFVMLENVHEKLYELCVVFIQRRALSPINPKP